jgi:hypothetical protein
MSFLFEQINFYIYCLASKLFRDEFIQCINVIYRFSRRQMGGSVNGLNRATMPSASNSISLVELQGNQTRT